METGAGECCFIDAARTFHSRRAPAAPITAPRAWVERGEQAVGDAHEGQGHMISDAVTSGASAGSASSNLPMASRRRITPSREAQATFTWGTPLSLALGTT